MVELKLLVFGSKKIYNIHFNFLPPSPLGKIPNSRGVYAPYADHAYIRTKIRLARSYFCC